MEDQGEAVVVRLASVSVEDSGQYTCVLANTIGQGTTRQSSRLTVVTTPRVRLALAGLNSERVRLVERSVSNITLSCSLQHSSKLRHSLHTVEWYMDNVLLYSLPDCQQPGSNLCDVDPKKLLLENVNRYFHGNFSCIGSLSTGLRSAMSNNVSVTVLYPPGSARIAISRQEVLYHGDEVAFTCSLPDEGRPRLAGYRWSLGGTEVPGQTSARLSVRMSDSGHANVSCQGYNEAGPGPPAHLNLTVMTGPRLEQSLLRHTSVLNTEPLLLVCQVLCRPRCQLRWYREGRLVRHSDTRFSVNNTISYQNNRKHYRFTKYSKFLHI